MSDAPQRRFEVLRRRRTWVVIVFVACVLFLGLLWERCGFSGCPNVDRLASYQPGGATILLDANGEQFADLAPVAYEVIEIDSLPFHVSAAFISVEDKRFYQHGGVDYRRVVGAALADIRARRFVQGFSTITMQLARNVWPERLPGQDRTLRRKILEIRVARDIEDAWEKNEILELYLNHIYFGGGSYGIEAASRNYFNKPAPRLTLDEAALLAALPRSPTLYNPRRYAERAKARRDLVLTLMEQQGYVTAEEAAAARETPMRVRRDPPARKVDAVVAPYFVEATRRVLEDRLGEAVYTAPLRVHTTLVRESQHVAEQRLEQQLRAIERGSFGRYEGERYQRDEFPENGPEYIQGAFILMNAVTGDIEALIGGRAFEHSRFDRATQSRRQAGSAFKPFVYAAAIAQGYAPSQFVSDSVLRLELPGGEVWEPQNIDREFEGRVTIRDAMVQSRNVPTIRLAMDVGLSDVTRLARRAGIRSDLPAVPSIAIGTAGVTALELTAAYTPFARLGTMVSPRFVTRVENANGRVLWEQDVETREVMDSATAYLITDMLEEAVDRGTARIVRRSGFRGTAAGKTGTTDRGADAWYVGYTPSHVATVWIGFDRPRPITDDATGGALAAPVWARVMREVADTGSWPAPSNVVQHNVDPASGQILVDGCRPVEGRPVIGLFIRGEEPAAVCPAGAPTVVRRSVFARLGGWFGTRWRTFQRWAERHFGSEEPLRAPREREYLGVPRLPRAEDVPEPRPFKPPLGVPIGTPIDTAADTLSADTLNVDTIPVDTILVDTMPADTMLREPLGEPVDTVAPTDTLRRGRG